MGGHGLSRADVARKKDTASAAAVRRHIPTTIHPGELRPERSL